MPAFHFKGSVSVCFGSNACVACLGQLHRLSQRAVGVLDLCTALKLSSSLYDFCNVENVD